MTKINLLDQASIIFPDDPYDLPHGLSWHPAGKPCYIFTPDKPKATKSRKRYKIVNFPSAGKMERGYTDWRVVDDQRSEAYARWLAARDGIELPDNAQASVNYEQLIIDGRKVKRTKDVTFGQKNKHFNKYGLVSYHLDVTKPMVTINIPHWDFVEKLVVEIIESMELAA
jgi:hypothetical protein